ncbi:hypothetical protein IW262DRAFT_1298410 [Armillaria fumosa]|nr:hypothetical protein IW262DRAFT_1298410 [Armillaria fumosa]
MTMTPPPDIPIAQTHPRLGALLPSHSSFTALVVVVLIFPTASFILDAPFDRITHHAVMPLPQPLTTIPYDPHKRVTLAQSILEAIPGAAHPNSWTPPLNQTWSRTALSSEPSTPDSTATRHVSFLDPQIRSGNSRRFLVPTEEVKHESDENLPSRCDSSPRSSSSTLVSTQVPNKVILTLSSGSTESGEGSAESDSSTRRSSLSSRLPKMRNPLGSKKQNNEARTSLAPCTQPYQYPYFATPPSGTNIILKALPRPEGGSTSSSSSVDFAALAMPESTWSTRVNFGGWLVLQSFISLALCQRYNSRPEVGVVQHLDSPIIGLKNFNTEAEPETEAESVTEADTAMVLLAAVAVVETLIDEEVVELLAGWLSSVIVN